MKRKYLILISLGIVLAAYAILLAGCDTKDSKKPSLPRAAMNSVPSRMEIVSATPIIVDGGIGKNPDIYVVVLRDTSTGAEYIMSVGTYQSYPNCIIQAAPPR